MLRLGSLCSGFGGLDLAVEEVFGARTIWQSEIGPAARILAERWPDVPNLGDLTRIDWHAVEPVDLVAAGYPCQPFSHAGRRKGINDARHLWPHIAEAVRVLRPSRVVLENVAGHRSLGFGNVLGDLAALGYDAQWTSIRASDAGAAHRRERVFIFATPDASRNGCARGAERDLRPPERELEASQRNNAHGRSAAATDAGSEEQSRGAGLRASDETTLWETGPSYSSDDRGFDWQEYGPAIERWAEIIGRRPPVPLVKGSNGGRAVSARFIEWHMGLPAGWVTDVQGMTKAEQIEALGNGVVPQQAILAFRQLLEITPLLRENEAV